MKRTGNLYERICSMENLQLADQKARRGKAKQLGVIDFDKDPGGNLGRLQEMLMTKTFRTSKYTHFQLCDPKPRLISRLPYFPDRIVHHAIMNELEGLFTAMFTSDTYSCIKGKGIHACKRAVEHALKDRAGTRYCLKLDIRKFYPSVDHDILKATLRRKIKDADLLWLLDEIIDSAPGVPIGNYLSQYFANFYLCYFDHWLKEAVGVKYYFRYADDMVIFSGDKADLHDICRQIDAYLAINLKLEMKRNYQVFPIDKHSGRGLDFIGYIFFHTHTRLRKRNKQNLARAIKRRDSRQAIMARRGWAIHCDSKNLITKLFQNDNFQRLQHRCPRSELRRGENQDRQDLKRGDRGARF